LGSKFTVEAGYIGRILRNEYQPLDLDAVPYMFTVGGQKFSNAYANLVLEYCGGVKGLAGGNCAGNAAAVTAQPFFETALGGTGSAYCKGFTSCTAAVAANEGNAGTGNLSAQNVWALWNDLDSPSAQLFGTGTKSPFQLGDSTNFTGQTLSQQLSSGAALNTSLGYGNYNALFLSGKTSDWHGLTMQTNFTYGKALGTGAVVQATSEYTAADPFWIGRTYGTQNWDRKFVYNVFFVYQPPYYKSQHGLIGHLLGGWTFSPIFVAGTGLPLYISTATGTNSFGESSGVSYFSNEQAVLIPGPGCSNFSTTEQTHVTGAAGVGTNTAYNLNLYKNPGAVIDCFRDPVLGFDTGHNGGYGSIARGQPYWNTDFQVRKTTHITERVSGEFQVIFSNLFNKVQFADPVMTLGYAPDWGALNSQLNNPRSMEFGFRIRF